MPEKLISCASLRPATRSSVPIYDFSDEHEELANNEMEFYFPCCGKRACGGCLHSHHVSGDNMKFKCPFCNAERSSIREDENIEEIMKWVEANDAASINLLANFYEQGRQNIQQDPTKAVELYARAAELGFSKAHYSLGMHYKKVGDMKKAKFHYETAAMAGHDGARYNLGGLEAQSGNLERELLSIGILLHQLGIIMPCITCNLDSNKVVLGENQSTPFWQLTTNPVPR